MRGLVELFQAEVYPVGNLLIDLCWMLCLEGVQERGKMPVEGLAKL